MSIPIVFSLVSAELSAADVGPLVRTIATAGSDGANSAAAAEAWRKLSRVDADQLPDVLAALNNAEPLAANWLSAAVDAIAERAIDQQRPLPTERLEQFVLDTSNVPRARRLAFLWLSRVDASAADRLIPGMLHDPGVEFRRDAVARLLDEAGRMLDADRSDDALKVYETALSGARDLDQVQTIASQMKRLGRPVELIDHFGFLVDWKLIGPFDNTDGQGFDVAYPPEREIDPAAVYEGKAAAVRWIDHTTVNELGMVDLNGELGKANSVTAYAVAEFHSAGEVNLQFRLGCINAAKLWLNGRLLGAFEVYHSGTEMDQYVMQGVVQPGRNVILLKVCQNEQPEEWAQDWQFQLRVCDAAGTAVRSQPPGSAP